jgi:argininosuccinate lyase
MRKQKSSEYPGFRTAGIRLSEDVLPDVEEHRSDRVLGTLYAVHQFDKAHLVMLAEEGLIPRKDAAAMLRILRESEREGTEKVRLGVGGGNHSGEQLLIRRLREEVGGAFTSVAARATWGRRYPERRCLGRGVLLPRDPEQ